MTDQNRCDQQQLTLYYYNELANDALQQVENHLNGCRECRTTLEQLKASLATIPITKLELDSAEKHRFTEQVMAATKSSRPWRKPIWASTLAAGAAVVLAIIIMPTSQQPLEKHNPALAEIEVLEQLELLQDLDILQDLELLEALEDLG